LRIRKRGGDEHRPHDVRLKVEVPKLEKILPRQEVARSQRQGIPLEDRSKPLSNTQCEATLKCLKVWNGGSRAASKPLLKDARGNLGQQAVELARHVSHRDVVA
jgi:hypothetical protein